MNKRLRVRAPELRGRAWINTGGRDLSLVDLRGRITVLDFWTFCCVNCLHVLDELRDLERRYQDTVVVVGVHSPKFAHEAEHDAVVDAVERYAVEHPVLDDPELATWKQYAVRAWPTLVVIDPEGYVVAQHAGEGHVHAIERLVTELVAEHTARGTLHVAGGPDQQSGAAGASAAPDASPEDAGDLRFPGKVLPLPGGAARAEAGAGARAAGGGSREAGGGTFLVSDSSRHSLVELDRDGETVLRRIGCGERGLVDGPPEVARFSEPQGLAALPDGTVAVADTVNHAVRRYDPATGEVTTLAGTGRQWRPGSPTAGRAREVDLSSPWDLAWFADRLWIAMAGTHQLWTFDPGTDTVRVAAGTTNEGLVDGDAAEAWFAQPSGLAVDAAGDRLWVADAETSALRYVERAAGPADGAGGPAAGPGSAGAEGPAGADGFVVRTAVGTGLFDFGHRDGPAGQALFQHPLGVGALPDGSVVVADTYNHAVRRYDPATGEVSTLATDLREPSDAVYVAGTSAGGAGADPDDTGAGVGTAAVVVVESARHRLTRLRLPADLSEEGLRVPAVAHRTQRAATEVAPGKCRLDVVFRPPAGQKLDTRYGPAVRLVVGSTPPDLLASGAGTGTDLGRDLVWADDVTEGVLHVSVMAASCDDDAATEHPACHVHQQDWGVPVRVTPDGTEHLPLVLAGLEQDTAG